MTRADGQPDERLVEHAVRSDDGHAPTAAARLIMIARRTSAVAKSFGEKTNSSSN